MHSFSLLLPLLCLGAAQGQDVDSDGNVDSATYLGCYSIPEENMADLRGIPSNAGLTQEGCFLACALDSARFYLLAAGNKCACGFEEEASIGDAIATDEGDCNLACSGAADETCGGSTQYQLYELFDGPPPTPATEEPTAAPTAEPTPEPTPEPTSEPTPEATDAPEPTPEATDAPEPTPEATDAPEPTPEATDAPETTEAPATPDAPATPETTEAPATPDAPATPETTEAPATPETTEFTCSGDAGIFADDVCCAASCGTCGGADCEDNDGGADACCVENIRENNMPCSVTGAAPCVAEGGYVNAGSVTEVAVQASAYDERAGDDGGCGEMGCMPMLAYDGVVDEAESRWSCAEMIVPGQCELLFSLKEPQDVKGIKVYLADEDFRRLKVKFNGKKMGEYDVEPGSKMVAIDVKGDDVSSILLESLTLPTNVYINILEVEIWV